MLKIMFTCFCLIAFPLYSEVDAKNEKSTIGKYQLVANDQNVYLLDTEKGTLWVANEVTLGIPCFSPWIELQSPVSKDVD